MTRALLIGAALLGGCVYYNGMYNANRLANAAEKAEREGRNFDAQNNWAQAEVRADTVLARHATSDWADDALLIKGKARFKLDDCPGAVAPLETVILNSPDGDLREEAAMVLAECQLRLQEPESALSLLLPAMASDDEDRRGRARVLQVRALNDLGRYRDALAVMDEAVWESFPEERLVALSGAGNVSDALALAESLRARPRIDSTIVWDTVLAVLGTADPAAGSRLTDLLLESDSVPAHRRGQLLMRDAERWLARDTTQAWARLAEAAAITPPNQYAMAALVAQAELVIARATSADDLDSATAILAQVEGGAGIEGLAATGLMEAIDRVRAAFDSISPGEANGDLETFLTAEVARDSLRAPALATALFWRVGDLWPESPYGPKALLALALAEPSRADAFRWEAGQRYPDSPYLEFLAGTSTPELRALEDSLRTYAFSRLGTPSQEVAPAGRRRRDQANDRPADELP